MKKSKCILWTTMILAILLCVTGCSCSHDEWVEATCTVPKTCASCGETEGEALGHKWIDATCAAPKTCSVCGETEGEALAHTWTEATCTAPKTCSVCGATEGEALGHNAPGLTCTEDAICERCQATVSAPGHQYTEATCTDAAKCSVCGEASGEPLGHTCTSGVCERCDKEVYETVFGHGDDVISDVTVGTGFYRVHFTHSGKRNFIVEAYDADDDWDLLVNTIGRYDEDVLLYGNSPFTFEITANGDWSYTIEPLGITTDTSFAGKGDYVTDLCLLESGTWEFTHDGKRNFIVWVYTTDGEDLLVNDIGSYNGKKRISIPEQSMAFFEITADGNWTVCQK